MAHRLTILPSALSVFAQKAEPVASDALGQNLASSNFVRRALLSYLHAAGIDRGYGYFAPNVPGSYKLVFEVHHGDGRVEYALPSVQSDAAGLRLGSLLDEIGRSRYAPMREYIVKTMARTVWNEYPDATMIRAVFGVDSLPSIRDFEEGKRREYQFLCAYEFSRGAGFAESQKP